MRLKNTFGCTAVIDSRKYRKSPRLKEFTGSSLDRETKVVKATIEEAKEDDYPDWVTDSNCVPALKEDKPLFTKLRRMSSRSKSKIRQKTNAFSQQYKRLTFITLTFVNAITDALAVVILRKFLDNYKKRKKDFQYIWVAERQTKNQVFKSNIHFHLITNVYWDIQKTWNYWLTLQAKHGITPRDENFKPSSAFDVKRIDSANIKVIGSYLTKYVTKNANYFGCQVWNCSKNVSALYTAFYSGYEFLDNVAKLGVQTKEVSLEHCNLHLIPLDRTTIRLYDRIADKNKAVLKRLNTIEQ